MERYFLHGLAESTRKTYNSAKRRYAEFAAKHGFQPLPASEHQLCQFVSYLAEGKLCHSTIKCYLSAVRQMHVAEGYGDPRMSSMARLEQVLRGIKSLQARTRGRSLPRLPITPDLLLKMKGVWQKRGTTWDNTMLWAAVTLCFFGFFRSGEITVPTTSAFDEGAHLTFRDVTVDSVEHPQVLRVRLKASKTDPFRVGINVFVGRTDKGVSAVLAYMAVRGPGPGPLFQFQDGRFLTRARLVTEVKEAISAGGVDSSPYSGHSFRSGAATTAARQGIAEATIQKLGRWKSSAYQLYIKTPRQELAAVSQRLAGNP